MFVTPSFLHRSDHGWRCLSFTSSVTESKLSFANWEIIVPWNPVLILKISSISSLIDPWSKKWKNIFNPFHFCRPSYKFQVCLVAKRKFFLRRHFCLLKRTTTLGQHRWRELCLFSGLWSTRASFLLEGVYKQHQWLASAWRQDYR